MNDNKGFTLVELLAIILILSIILTLSVVVSTRIIKNSKEKSYQVTINNIENIANSYINENSNKLPYIQIKDGEDMIEYQCVSIKNLIDMGYFKNDVLKSKYKEDTEVSENDYVYLERDKFKKISKNIFLGTYDKNNIYVKRCNEISGLTGNISFSIKPDSWSKEKNVIIKYNLNNINTTKETNYTYGYSINDKEPVIDGNNTKNIKVSENGKLTASIYTELGVKIKTANIYINNIDKDSPTITFSSNGDNVYTKEKKINIEINDNASGIKTADVSYGWSTSKSSEPSNYVNAPLNYQNGDKKIKFNAIGKELTGEYYLWIKYNLSDVADNAKSDTICSSGVFKFDNEPPTGTATLTNNKDVVTLNVNASDNGSGIAKYEYIIHQSNICPTTGYQKENSYTVPRSGTYYGCVKITDNTGNSIIIKSNNNLIINKGFEFTYSGDYKFAGDKNNNWELALLTSGSLTISSITTGVDVWYQAAGYNGESHSNVDNWGNHGGSGGGGGYHYMVHDLPLYAGHQYNAVIGESNGAPSSVFGYSSSSGSQGAAGGSGGYCNSNVSEFWEPTSGGNGYYAFDDPNTLYRPGYRYGAGGGAAPGAGFNSGVGWTYRGTATSGGSDGGGGGGATHNSGGNGAANSGSGGGGGGVGGPTGGTGGSGIIIIRNNR